MIKKYGIYILFCFSLLIYVVVKIKKQYFKQHNYSIQLLQQKSGWGYVVYKNEQLFIQQKYMPDISGYHCFANKNDALKTANLVVSKLLQKQMPTVTKADLESLKITLPPLSK